MAEREHPRTARSESPEQRADRNWSELLQELRVSQTGVQVLAAFLVTLPFQARFAELDAFQRRWYLGLTAMAFLTVGVTLTPVAIHRRLFRRAVKPQLVQAGHLLTQIALGLIAMLLSGIAFLVADVVAGRAAALVGGVATATVMLGLLVVTPLAIQSGLHSRLHPHLDADDTEEI